MATVHQWLGIKTQFIEQSYSPLYKVLENFGRGHLQQTIKRPTKGVKVAQYLRFWENPTSPYEVQIQC